MEVRARRLAREIRRTSSRVNALRTRVIPDLEAETQTIAGTLEQREREDRFRLKRVKTHREQARPKARCASPANPASRVPGPSRSPASAERVRHQLPEPAGI
jgi:hypothetical protein